MAGSQTIESYVNDIMENLEELDYDSLGNAYETLQKMKTSQKLKHELNYWKVLQCLGEMATDLFMKVIPRCEKSSCQCHIYSNINSVLQLFTDTLSNIYIIRRVIVNKQRVVPTLFKAIRQSEDPTLLRNGLKCMYRLLIVGKGEIVDVFIKFRILKELYEQIRRRQGVFGYFSVLTVSYCAKLLLGLVELGDMKTRNVIRRSHAKQALITFTVKFKKAEVHREYYEDLNFCFTRIKTLLENENMAQIATDKWNSKEKLKEDAEQAKNDYIFCSSPSCRKKYTIGDNFQYCGDCRLARYCSRNCQKEHWKQGHKENCLKEAQWISDKCVTCPGPRCGK